MNKEVKLNKYSVGVIGAGSIGAMKTDRIDSPLTHLPLTHAHAIYNDARFKLSWIYDVSEAKYKQACIKWNCDINLDPVDVIVISTPTSSHLEEVEKICKRNKKWKPKVIILEKPAGMNIHECTKIDYLCKENNIQVMVNYGRRYCKPITEAIQLIKNENVQQIVFYYTRGLIRDGSHAIDIINQFFTTVRAEVVLDHDHDPLIDYDKSDPTYELIMHSMSRVTARLIPIDGRLYDIFEMHIFTNEARWVFDDHFKTITRQSKKKESTYGDYFSMPGVSKIDCFNRKKTTDLEWSLKYLYDDVYKFLEDKTYRLKCTLSDALRVHVVLDKAFIDLKIKQSNS